MSLNRTVAQSAPGSPAGAAPPESDSGVEQLDEVRVLEDVQAVPGRPLRRDAPGVRDPVPVEHRRAAPRLRQRRAALRPEVPGDEPNGRLDTLPARHLREAQEVVREPDEHGDPEAAHQGDLLDRRGVAAGAGGEEPRSGEVQERLADVVPAVHHPEPVHRVHDVVVAEPVQAIGAREKGVLDLPVPRPVEDRLGVPRRAARGMEHRRVAAIRPGPGPGSGRAAVHSVEVAERGMLAHALHEVLLGEGGELRDIVEAADISRLEPRRPPAPRVEGHLPAAGDHPAEAPVLEGAELVGAEAGGAREERLPGRKFFEKPARPRLLEIARHAGGRPLSQRAGSESGHGNEVVDEGRPRPAATRAGRRPR